MTPNNSSARQASRATQEAADELGALHLDRQHLPAHAKHFEGRANSLFQPFWRADVLLIASLKEAFGPAWAEQKSGGSWSFSTIQKGYVVLYLQLGKQAMDMLLHSISH